jgi:hypothetical protein
MIMQSAQQTDRHPIPGISAAEADAMHASATRFLARAGIDAETSALDALTENADAHAAGRASASRDMYIRDKGAHFMLMPLQRD